MGTIDINKYISCPASVCDLHGRCWSSQKDDGIPCRIRVGPRRFLNERVNPEELKLTIWQNRGGHVTYHPSLDVPTTVDENGHLTIDAVSLMRNHFGTDISFCSKDYWRWYKRQSWSDTFLTTPHGVATSRSTWLDINWTHSGLYLAPGTLRLCNHDVLYISWSSFEDECGAHSRTMRPLVEKLLSGPHVLTAETFKKQLEDIKIIQEYGINRLMLSTDHGTYHLDSSLHEHISVSLKDSQDIGKGYKLSRRCGPMEMVDILLQLMQAGSSQAVHNTLENLHQQGLVAKAR